MTYGEIPDGLCVLHKCDNPACVRPDHLFLGTTQDNTADMIKKGRRYPSNLLDTSGEHNGNHKLTSADVIAIRERYAKGGITQSDLAKTYKVDSSVVTSVVNYKTWKNVK
jgi:ribosome-binding protein aMBF1 (putative translation factor)